MRNDILKLMFIVKLANKKIFSNKQDFFSLFSISSVAITILNIFKLITFTF